MEYSYEELLSLYGFLVDFVKDWGYVAVFLGSMIEGESVIFLAGFFAHQGHLSLPKMTLVAFLGTLVADQGLYFIGRHYGNHVIDKFPSFRPRADRAFRLLRRYENSFILSFRFIWGIRIISPIIIGASGVPVKRFMFLNLIAAVIWSVVSCVAAYYFAHIMIEFFHMFPKILLGLVIAGGLIGFGIYKWRQWKAKTLIKEGSNVS